ncbi:MAG TPA: multicopper oxidase domain-containing protein [Actinomycetospora sp.]|uniref:multicopper oxidase family protein n=1 Tax=Actinomycetospora sp. TaxID=1872135 RepID=UPI002F3E3811
MEAFTAEIVAPTPQAVHGEVDVELTPTEATIHPDLRAMAAWGYGVDGGPVTMPGPLLEARADEPVTLTFHNRLGKSGLPFLAWKTTTENKADGNSPQVDPGVAAAGSEGVPQDQTGKPIGLTVTHLHGGHSIPDSDGWPDNMMRTNGRQVCRYDNDSDSRDLGLIKRGPMQWYHDHAMGGTGFHVYAGLAGPYLVRDPREKALRLPCTPADGEAVLMITDRNIVDDAELMSPAPASGDGHVAASDGHAAEPMHSLRFLHKITPETAEFFGPLTLVGGKLWPTLKVGPGVVRLRLYGVGNSRVFRLHLLDESLTCMDPERLRLVGTDGGLLWRAQPVDVEAGITLAPAERADLLVDLRGLEPGTRIFVVNSAQAPFHGDPPSTPLTRSRPEDRIPFPQVMSLLVDEEAPRSPHADLWEDVTNRVLNPDFRRVIHTQPVAGGAPEVSIEGHDHHAVLLVEDPTGHLTLQEIEHAPPDANGNPATGPILLQLPNDTQPVAYRPVNLAPAVPGPTGDFYSTLGIYAELDRWQVFSFLNTTGDVHPLHIHQSEFQPVNDRADTYDFAVPADQPIVRTGPGRAYEPHERFGWKDTVRVFPNELVAVAIRFDLLGKYVYHCHILEHEDNEMMRSFLVIPPGMTPSGMGMSMAAPASTDGGKGGTA